MTGRNVRIAMCWASLALVAAPVFAQQAPGRAGAAGRRAGIEGRWNITVTEGNSTYPSWLGVERKEGKLEARFLGRAGGVGGADDLKFENNTVTFKAHGREWMGKLDGATIEGTWKKNDGQGTWVARRSMRRIDVSGKWNVKAGNEEAVLTLTRERRQISGTWSQGGQQTAIAEPRLAGGMLSFTVNGKTMRATVKGDVLEGRNFTGRRDRKWGKPVELFAGKESDMANWEPLGSGDNWKVVDGVLTNGKEHTENLVTKRKDFRNFKLHVEFKVPERGNSGVYLRGRHEVQIADSYGRPIEAGGCGAMYSRILPKVNASKPAGEWQTYEIVFIDNYLTVIHNDQLIMDNVEVEGITGGAIDSNEWEPGPIYLQGDHSQIFYRKIVLTPAQ